MLSAAWTRRVVGFLLVFLLTAQAGRATTPEIWLAPLQPTVREDGGKAGVNDFANLFAPDAPWSVVAARIKVFKVYPSWLREASDDAIRRMVAGLAGRHIALGLESPVLVDTALCNKPGVTRVAWMVPLVERLKRLGGDLRYLAMVGPLVDGHSAQGQFGCHRPIPEVAADAARTVAAIRRSFPDLEVGEIEPVGSGPGYTDWRELPEWFTAFERASGHKLAFLHMDIEWGKDWRPALLEVAGRTRSAGIPFGVIYDGYPTELSDAGNSRAVLRHADEVEALPGMPPDQVIFQSWFDFPRHALPQSDPSSMTGAIMSYLRPRSVIEPVSAGKIRLVDGAGHPVAGAEIAIEAFSPMADFPLQDQEIGGMVPHAAASARFAFRVHTECACTADASSIVLGSFHFHQPDDPRPPVNWNLQPWMTQWKGVLGHAVVNGATVLQANVPTGQKLVLNGPLFPVSADAAFAAHFAWRVDPRSAGSGVAMVIFADAAGNEIRRSTAIMATTWHTVGHVVTGADGTSVLPSTPGPEGRRLLSYTGDSAHRPASLELDTLP